MPIKAVIFDMDGVLVDSEVYWDRSRVEFARDRGKTWTDEYQRLAMGRSTIGWARVMQEKLTLNESIDEIIAEMKARVIDHYQARMPTRPGALESVAHMKEHFRIGLGVRLPHGDHQGCPAHYRTGSDLRSDDLRRRGAARQTGARHLPGSAEGAGCYPGGQPGHRRLGRMACGPSRRLACLQWRRPARISRCPTTFSRWRMRISPRWKTSMWTSSGGSSASGVPSSLRHQGQREY